MTAAPGVQPEEDGRVQCLECRQWFRALPAHLNRREGLTADEYRERHGLAATHPLVSSDLSERWRQQTTARLHAGDVVPIAERMPPEGRAAAGRAGTARHVETSSRPEVRDRHRAAVAKGRSMAHANKRAALDALATTRGYTDWGDLIRSTLHLSVNRLGQNVGRDPRTIAYWRNAIVGPGWKDRGGRLHPKRQAAYDRLDQLFTDRGWGDLEAAVTEAGSLNKLARLLGTGAATLRAWQLHRGGPRSGSAETPS
ncbi:MucR family transcriptional regulator [Streptomyces halobius]|uniref:MucR family transcriptional regulator n=1 Tax=Streptomyces halobius TaxID=2879846 RepID=A0ABY4M563_9ACTN|nr:MucR family transcriptional regulator [Streptomyces halobius]UQA91376.1 MucR family transcriptional regulator [Streptomyces halobius]